MARLNCIKCGGTFKKVGWLRTKGYRCMDCQGVFVRFRHLAQAEVIGRLLQKEAKRSKNSTLVCAMCSEEMKRLEIGKTGLEIDFCPLDFNVWFDFKEPDKYVAWLRRYHPKKKSINPQNPSDIAVSAAMFYDP